MSHAAQIPPHGLRPLAAQCRSALETQNDKVRRLEQANLVPPQVNLGTQNLTHGGMHLRWIFVPAGTTLTGAQTKLPNACIVFGDIAVTTENGPVRLTGFNVLPAQPGAKRAGTALADTWWATIWRTDLTDLRAIEDEVTDESAMLQTRRDGIEWATAPELEG